MEVLDIATLKKIIENVPDDFEVLVNNRKSEFKLSDKFEVDVSSKKNILKKILINLLV